MMITCKRFCFISKRFVPLHHLLTPVTLSGCEYILAFPETTVTGESQNKQWPTEAIGRGSSQSKQWEVGCILKLFMLRIKSESLADGRQPHLGPEIRQSLEWTLHI